MFTDQNVLVVTICVLVGLLIWGRWRYDAVTLVALAALVLFEVIPINSAFFRIWPSCSYYCGFGAIDQQRPARIWFCWINRWATF